VRCVVIKEENLVIQDRPDPSPGPRDVIVNVHAFGLNAADLMQRRGLYPAPEGWPADIPGMELAGVVSEIGGEVDRPLVGRRVCALVGGGAQATHVAVPSEHLIFIPNHVNWQHAAGFAEAFTTAYDALVNQAHLQSGERVLISGAAGGVGTAGVQIAHLLGAHVIAITRTKEHHDRLQNLGANETLVVDDLSNVGPIDVVLELVGAANLSLVQRHLAAHARVVVIGVGGGARVEIDLLNVMVKRATITGSTLRSRSREEKAAVISQINEHLVPAWNDGELQVPVAAQFDFENVTQAYEFFAEPGKLGKVVVNVNE
jgi:NADPH:quinone reductase-like Zn-dependent oxidoreductase